MNWNYKDTSFKHISFLWEIILGKCYPVSAVYLLPNFPKKMQGFPFSFFIHFVNSKKIQIFYMISIFCNIFQEKWKMYKTNLCKNCGICFLLLQAFHRSIKCWNPPTATCKYVKVFYDISKLWSTFFAFVIFTDINISIFFWTPR